MGSFSPTWLPLDLYTVLCCFICYKQQNALRWDTELERSHGQSRVGMIPGSHEVCKISVSTYRKPTKTKDNKQLGDLNYYSLLNLLNMMIQLGN